MAKATSLADSLVKRLECAVCLEQYTDPKVLPCLHSFCKRCLHGLLTEEKGAVFKINCPTCRSSAEIPQGQIDALPVNFFVNNLLSMVALHKDSGSSNLECDICDSGDPPVNRCTTCSHFLCEFCTQGHLRGRSTRSHSLMSLEEARKIGSVALTKPSLCKEHEGEVMKLFCETCEEAICRDCTIVKHRDHKYTFVKDAFSKGKESLLKRLSETRTKVCVLEEAVDGVLNMKSNVHSCAEQTVRAIVNCFNELTACLDVRRGKLIDKVEEIKKAKLKSLEIQQEELETALGSVRSSVEFTEKAFENGSEVEILNMRKQMSCRLQDLNCAKWQLEPCVNEGLKFKDDGQLKRGIATCGAVTDVVTHAGMSTVTMENGKEGVMYNTLCGQPVEFKIIAKEQNGKKRNEGGDVFVVHVNESAGSPLVLKARDNGNGTYSFSHTPAKEGHYTLSVYLNSRHVQRSPFQWCVEKWNLQPFSCDKSQGQLELSKEPLRAQVPFYGYNEDYGHRHGYPPIKSMARQVYGRRKGHSRRQQALNAGYCQGSGSRQNYDDRQNYDYRQDYDYGDIDVRYDPLKKEYAVGSVGFTNGKHMWKVQIHGNISQGFSLGIIETIRNKNGKLVRLGNHRWVWKSENNQAYKEVEVCEATSSLLSAYEAALLEKDDEEVSWAELNVNQFKSEDIVQLYLNFEDGTLMLYNPRTSYLHILDGIEENIYVSPVFRMSNNGTNQVSLKI